jgi:hypothetical protein
MSGIQKLTFLALFLIAGFAATNAYLTYTWLNTSSDPGWVEGHDGEKVIVLRTRGDGEGAQLRYGDEILLLNGHPVQKYFSIYLAFERVPSSVEMRLSPLSSVSN